MLPKLFHAIGLTGISLILLSGCSREADVIFPSDAPEEQVNSCSEIVPNEQLLNALSVREPSRHTGVAGIELDQAFDPDVYVYNASVSPLTNAVTVFPAQVLTDPDGLIQSLTVNVKVETSEQTLDTSLSYLQESPWIYLPEGNTQIQLEVEAILNNRSVFVDCEPSLEQQASVITQSRTYRINIDRPSRDLIPTIFNPEKLVEGTSLNAYVEGEKPFDAQDRFGKSIGLYGDIMVVGAPGDDNGDPLYLGTTTLTDSNRLDFLLSLADDDNILEDSGAVYVFERQAIGDWQLTHVLKPEFPDAGDQFGHAVAVYGDVIAVSALYEDSASTGVNGIEDNELAPDSGAVYVFRRQGSDYVQEAYIKAQVNTLGNDGYHDAFGDQLRLDEDQLLVSAPLDDNGSTADVGSVQLYEMEGSAWEYSTSLSSSLAQANDNFGAAIAIHGDLIAVGAPGDDSDVKVLTHADEIGDLAARFEDENPFLAADSGAVHIFQKNNDSWTQQAYMKVSNADAGDRFGNAVSLSGYTLFVGAPREDGSGIGFNKNLSSNNLSNSGAVYHFSLISEFGNWTLENYIKASVPVAGALFGQSVASDYTRLLVGAPKEITIPGQAQGKLYALELTPSETRYWFNLTFWDDNDGSALENAFRALSITPGAIAGGAQGASFPILDPNTLDVLSYESNVGMVGLSE